MIWLLFDPPRNDVRNGNDSEKVMNAGSVVTLKAFNGTAEATEGCPENENYWKLVGSKGVVFQSPLESGLHASFSSQKRVLVRFEKDLEGLGLEVHNEIDNSLWILESDLMVE